MNPRVIFVPGVFDKLHAGHINLLWKAKQLGDVLVVGVVSCEGTAAYKGQRPLQTTERRMQTIERLSFVDVVERQATTDPTPLLVRFQPSALVHGDDWTELREGNETLQRLGIEFIRLPYTPGISSTLLRQVV